MSGSVRIHAFTFAEGLRGTRHGSVRLTRLYFEVDARI